jgi:hypothetical protein
VALRLLYLIFDHLLHLLIEQPRGTALEPVDHPAGVVETLLAR